DRVANIAAPDSTPLFIVAVAVLALLVVWVSISIHGGLVGRSLVLAVTMILLTVLIWGSADYPLLALLIIWGVFVANADVATRVSLRNGELYSRFWASRERVRNALVARDPSPALVEMDDGIISYSLGLPGLSGFGLAGDAELVAAKQRGRMLE